MFMCLIIFYTVTINKKMKIRIIFFFKFQMISGALGPSDFP